MHIYCLMDVSLVFGQVDIFEDMTHDALEGVELLISLLDHEVYGLHDA
jgi:hypothetical protein